MQNKQGDKQQLGSQIDAEQVRMFAEWVDEQEQRGQLLGNNLNVLVKRGKLAVLGVLVSLTLAAHAAKVPTATVFVDAPEFETTLDAAITKKGTPLVVTMDKTKAQYILRTSSVATHVESGAGKVARCMFAYCMGIEDSANVSASLLSNSDQTIVWAYSVNKQRGQKNQQALAEAIAKHLKAYLEGTGK